MRTTKKVISAVLAVCMLASTSVLSSMAAPVDDTSSVGGNTVYSAACEEIDNEYAYNGNDLGATYAPEETTFKVWSPTATEIKLNLFATGSDEEEGAADLGNYTLEKVVEDGKFTGVWAVTVSGDLKNIYYTYTITVVPTTGGDPVTRETQDIYSVATGVNGNRSMVCDLDSTDPEGWENDKHVLLNEVTDSSVWELHVKDFSYDPASGVSEANRGKFLAFTENGTTLNGEGNIATCIDYLKELGVTTVQINPFYDFQSINEAGSSDQFNWGYDPQNYNVPEGSYSSNPYDGNVRITECKQMIKALHDAGFSVVMDVVYNHTYSTDSSFNRTVPNYYYRMQDKSLYGCADGCGYVDTEAASVCPNCGSTSGLKLLYKCPDCDFYSYGSAKDCGNGCVNADTGKAVKTKRVYTVGDYSSGSGCGNDCATERAMYRNFVINSCRYWVDEYHVDGFRYDLMGLMDVETMNMIRDNLDEVSEKITMWGEGWSMTTTTPKNTCSGQPLKLATQVNANLVSDRIAFFNDAIRDKIKGSYSDIMDKGFIQGNSDVSVLNGLYYGITGNTTKNGWQAQCPGQSVTYASCHDNATLYDKICASTGFASYGERNADAVKINKLAAAILYASQGVTFYQAGEEMCRTKYGDSNSYKSSPEINKLQWQNIVDYADVVAYYQGLNKIKQNFSPLTCDDNSCKDNFIFNHNPSKSNPSNTFAYTISNNTPGEWSKMAVLLNSSSKNSKITLADTSVTDWVVIANADFAGLDKLEEVTGSTFEVPARSAVIAVEKSSFEATASESTMGKVKVNYIYSVNGKPLTASMLIQGTIGTKYQTLPSAAIPESYVVSRVDGDELGTFAEGLTEVTYYYKDYVPESVLNADFDGDEKISVMDATLMQKYLVELVEFTEDQKERFDLDYDGKKSVMDCTMLLKYIAELPISTGSITVNHYYNDPVTGAQKKLTNSVVMNGIVGSEYKTETYKVVGYAVDKTRMPERTSGKMPYGSIEVNYYYTTSSLDIKLHVKHNGDLAWAPTLWIWGSNLNGVDSGNYTTSKTWPGDTIADEDGDGWFDYGFAYEGAGTFNIIVSNGGKIQTVDYKGFVDNEIWIVIDDENVTGGTYLEFYTENPDTNPDAPLAQHNPI